MTQPGIPQSSERDSFRFMTRVIRVKQVVQAFEEAIEASPIPWDALSSEAAADAGRVVADHFIATWERHRDRGEGIVT